MSRRHLPLFVLLAVPLLGAADTGPRPRQSTGGDFALRQWTVDAGGGAAVGGDLSMQGVIGQADAAESAGGTYMLYGGFVRPAARTESPEQLFANGFESAQ